VQTLDNFVQIKVEALGPGTPKKSCKQVVSSGTARQFSDFFLFSNFRKEQPLERALCSVVDEASHVVRNYLRIVQKSSKCTGLLKTMGRDLLAQCIAAKQKDRDSIKQQQKP